LGVAKCFSLTLSADATLSFVYLRNPDRVWILDPSALEKQSRDRAGTCGSLDGPSTNYCLVGLVLFQELELWKAAEMVMMIVQGNERRLFLQGRATIKTTHALQISPRINSWIQEE
jgi:hypothetical protein